MPSFNLRSTNIVPGGAPTNRLHQSWGPPNEVPGRGRGQMVGGTGVPLSVQEQKKARVQAGKQATLDAYGSVLSDAGLSSGIEHLTPLELTNMRKLWDYMHSEFACTEMSLGAARVLEPMRTNGTREVVKPAINARLRSVAIEAWDHASLRAAYMDTKRRFPERF